MSAANPKPAPKRRGRPPRSALADADSPVRANLLEVAVELFSANDYQAVSTREITRRAGVSLSALAHYYGDKRGLYIAANLRELRKISARLEAAISTTGDPTARLFRFMVEYSRVLSEPVYRIVVRQHMGGEPEAVTLIARDTFPEQVKRVAGAIEAIDAATGPAMPRVIALYSLMHGLHSIRPVTDSLPWETGVPVAPADEAIYALSIVVPEVDWSEVRGVSQDG